MKKLVTMITLGVLCILALSPVGAAAQTTDPVAVVDAFRAAVGHDTAAGVALVTDDAVVSIVPPPPNTSGVWTGKEQVRQYLEFSVMKNGVHERKGDARVEGDKVTMTVMVLNDDFRQWGIAAVEHTYDAVVQGGKIKSITITMAVAERARVRAAAEAYMAAQGGQPPAGMPRTGGEQSLPFLLLTAISMLAALVGLGLRRTIKSNIQ
jgi:hypothetical protein